jgi:hypothetical protein
VLAHRVCELTLDEMVQERPEAPNRCSPGKVFREPHPLSWPIVEVFAEGRRSSATAACEGARAASVPGLVFRP